MNNNKNLKVGTAVRYDGRAQGIQTGVITRREAIKGYYDPSTETVFYEIDKSGLLMGADDILEVLN